MPITKERFAEVLQAAGRIVEQYKQDMDGMAEVLEYFMAKEIDQWKFIEIYRRYFRDAELVLAKDEALILAEMRQQKLAWKRNESNARARAKARGKIIEAKPIPSAPTPVIYTERDELMRSMFGNKIDMTPSKIAVDMPMEAMVPESSPIGFDFDPNEGPMVDSVPVNPKPQDPRLFAKPKEISNDDITKLLGEALDEKGNLRNVPSRPFKFIIGPNGEKLV